MTMRNNHDIKHQAYNLATKYFSKLFLLLCAPLLLIILGSLFAGISSKTLGVIGLIAIFIGSFVSLGAMWYIAEALQNPEAIKKRSFKDCFSIFHGSTWVNILVLAVEYYLVYFGASLAVLLVALIGMAIHWAVGMVLMVVGYCAIVLLNVYISYAYLIVLDAGKHFPGSQLDYTSFYYEDGTFFGAWKLGWAAMKKSVKLMKGHFWKNVGLEISLIGWMFLSFLIFPLIFVFPYFVAVEVNWYLDLTKEDYVEVEAPTIDIPEMPK